MTMKSTTTTAPEQQPRIVPTGPGWWWGIPKTMDGDVEVVAIRVTQSEYSGDLLAACLGSVGMWMEDVYWLTPIPSPAELARLRAVADAARRVVGEERPWLWVGGVAVCRECNGQSSSAIVADIHHVGECSMGGLVAAVDVLLGGEA